MQKAGAQWTKALNLFDLLKSGRSIMQQKMTGRCRDMVLSTLLETADKHYDTLQSD
jgi:hypothetical protein